MGDDPQGVRLHHIGYVTSSIEGAVAAYVSRYGYKVVTPVIHDPLQTAFVQFLQLSGEATYLEFVAPDRPDSYLTSTAKRGGLHHLCFAAGKLELAIARLEENGMRLISEPKPAVAFG